MRLIGALVFLAGCEATYDSELGASPGGVEDIAYAREIIANGGVPYPEDIAVEGLLSEHDLPTVGAPCEDLLCVRPALGIAPSPLTGKGEYWLQLGMTSGLPVPLQRPPLDLVLTIDQSASMSIDLAQVEEAVARLLDHLGPDDRLAVIAFNDDVTVLHPLQHVDDANALEQAVRGLHAEGNWGLQPAMERAYGMLESVGNDPRRLRRVMLFTCGYPLVDENRSDPFSQLAIEGAQKRIGLSVYGILLGWYPELGDLLGEVHGGSYSYISGLEAVEQMFDTDFDTMVTPLAYDLHLAIDPGTRFAVDRVVGVPGEDAVASAEIDVATVFASNRRGAVFARLSSLSVPDGQDTVATVDLSYLPEPAHGLIGRTDAIAPIVEPDNDGTWFQSPGVRKGVALIHEADLLSRSCEEFHAGDADAAEATAILLRDHLVAESAEVDGLEAEVALVEKLIENIRNGGNL